MIVQYLQFSLKLIAALNRINLAPFEYLSTNNFAFKILSYVAHRINCFGLYDLVLA